MAATLTELPIQEVAHSIHARLLPGLASVVLADGHRRFVIDVGPVEVGFRNRHCFSAATVLGDEALMGGF